GTTILAREGRCLVRRNRGVPAVRWSACSPAAHWRRPGRRRTAGPRLRRQTDQELEVLPVIDIHVHIQPLDLFKPAALELMKRGRRDFDQLERFSKDPSAFLEFLDEAGVERAGLINYASPHVIGLPPEVNNWDTRY